jgi:predicted nucleic acid-binding protein
VAAIVIADASPLIALARVDGLPWLGALFGEVLITDVVEDRLRLAFEAGWMRSVVSPAEGPDLPDLDEGEAASIRLALSLGQGGEALLLIDERAGRAVAQALGIRVAGTAAVIGLAHQRGLIPSARAVFAQLHASDFRIAPAVIQTVLERCGE